MYRDMSGSLQNRTYNPCTHIQFIHTYENIHTYTQTRTYTINTCTQTHMCTLYTHLVTLRTLISPLIRSLQFFVRYASTLAKEVKI